MNGLALITGASGLIGRFVAERLINDGREVRVTVRQADRLDPGLRSSLDVRVGDLRDEQFVAQAMAGVSEIFHLAACTKAWSRDPNEFFDVNVGAVQTMLECAADGVEQFIHVSTILTYPPYKPAPTNGRASRLTPYEVTKKAGETLVEQYAANGGKAVIVHPSRVYGPGPLNDANAVTRTIALYLKGQFRTRLADRDVLGNYVHASDVAEGMILAAEHGRSGAHYLLGGRENVSFISFLGHVATAAGIPPKRVLPVPIPISITVGHVALLIAQLGGPALITPEWIRTLLEDRRIEIGPAETEIGYAPQPLEDGLADTIAWLRSEGYVR